MSDLKGASELVAAAERDIAALRVMVDSTEVSDEVFGFHTQQAAEKSLKAWIALLGKEYPLIHNIAGLLNFLCELDVNVEPYRSLFKYTPYAVVFRYQGAQSDADPIDRKVALSLVESLISEVRGELAAKTAS